MEELIVFTTSSSKIVLFVKGSRMYDTKKAIFEYDYYFKLTLPKSVSGSYNWNKGFLTFDDVEFQNEYPDHLGEFDYRLLVSALFSNKRF